MKTQKMKEAKYGRLAKHMKDETKTREFNELECCYRKAPSSNPRRNRP
jgi:hypothetical protein